MIIAVDFDGTIVEHRYPEIGEEIPFAFKTLRSLIERGHQVILWTFRSGKELNDALEFCRSNGVVFFAVNNNTPDEIYDSKNSRKIYADVYIDDRNILGIPDWLTIYKMIQNGD
jgi:hydroxymethylpyrimidine pyrophosphatase-like HAD family hydrolase